MRIRIAVLGDLPELLDIYNYEVLNGYATFDSIPQTYEQRKVWFEEHNKDHHPLIVAVDDEGKIAGYSSLSSYRPKDSYKPSVELSVYVSPNHRRMGVATVLMEHILEMARDIPWFRSLPAETMPASVCTKNSVSRIAERSVKSESSSANS